MYYLPVKTAIYGKPVNTESTVYLNFSIKNYKRYIPQVEVSYFLGNK